MASGGTDGERKITVLSPRIIVLDISAVISALFDTSDRKQCQALHEARALLQEYGDIEALNQDLFVLHIFSGVARELLP